MTIEMLSIIGATVAVSVGAIGPALAEGRAIATAMEAIARQPEASGTISTNMLIAAALVEGVSVIALILMLIL